MTIEKERLISLIEFAQQAARLRNAPISSVAQHGIFSLHEHELQGLPGIRLNGMGAEAGDEIWLAVERLHEQHPPEISGSIAKPWVQLTQDPNDKPSLRDAVEGASLIAAGTHYSALKAGVATEDAQSVVHPRKKILLVEYEQAPQVEAQFSAYLEEKWHPWAEKEKLRRKTIHIYNRLFSLKQKLEGGLVEAQIELLWGAGIGIWQTNGATVNYPLVGHWVELSLNQKTSEIEIRPRRTMDARLEVEWYAATDNAGVTALENAAKNFFDKEASSAFSPFDGAAFEPILRMAVTHLDANGIYWPDKVPAEDRALPKPESQLKVTNTWVLFARPRTKNLFVQDLENFKKAVGGLGDHQPLPPAGAAVVTDPASDNPIVGFPAYRGISGSCHSGGERSGQKTRDLFFPKPFNDEQVRIVQLLETSDGVVVQGPPGTGKTHTIANVICHYLAEGKRVLVTSMKDPALAVLREKLPLEIQPFAISLLTNEQEGMKQFEHAIGAIAYEAGHLDRVATAKDIQRLEETIDALHGKLSQITYEIGEWAKDHLTKVVVDGEEIEPQDAAREVVENAGQFEWIPDALEVGSAFSPQFSDADVIRLREARRVLGKDVGYWCASLPQLAEFPDAQMLLEAHQNLSQLEVLRQKVEKGLVPPLADITPYALDVVQDLLAHIETLRRLREGVASCSWADSLKKRLLQRGKDDLIIRLEILGGKLETADAERKAFLDRGVVVPSDADNDSEFVDAVKNLAAGRRAFGLKGLFGKSGQKKQLESVRIGVTKPASAADWAHVQAWLGLQLRFRELAFGWNALARELSIELVNGSSPEDGWIAFQKYLIYLKVNKIIEVELWLKKSAEGLFPGWHSARESVVDSRHLEALDGALRHHLTQSRLANAWAIKKRLQVTLDGRRGQVGGPVIEAIHQFQAQVLGNPEVSDVVMRANWSALMSELSRILALEDYFETIREVCGRVKASGAPAYAEVLRKPFTGSVDDCLPNHWRHAWRLKRLSTYLGKFDTHEELKRLTRVRRDLESQLLRAYHDVVVKRVKSKTVERASRDVRAALQAYLSAIQKIGKGTGVRAVRYRQDAREAAVSANPAVPCWIMPHYRVSETLPSELGCFDLVIIDEASQSDLDALPALLRAKKVLIVGDDKQVSPEAVGLAEEKVRISMARFLGSQVPIYRPQMSPDRSIYDLFKVVFSSSTVMLKEHFRCAGPIIEYSKREFYNHELHPLRVAKASERLDPPLIDVFISNGYRKGDTNPPEVRFIVDEIKKIVDDPKMIGRTIGMVSLLADKQALAVWDCLTGEIGPEIMERHHIACGDARTFQGKERDIMFLSMVCAPDEKRVAPLSRDAFAQRFNVAASRARDRMYLVRSVELEHLSDADRLRRNLISHFSVPFAQDEARVEDLRKLCESPFEREVYDELVQRGYLVTPQVRAGKYRIDMVVEGHNDARLAIECDGDKYHGADKWADDMDRQRVLERAGWFFWRCFASYFVRHREDAMTDLVATLTERGIDPIGAEGAPKGMHVERRTVDTAPMAEEAPIAEAETEMESDFEEGVKEEAVLRSSDKGVESNESDGSCGDDMPVAVRAPLFPATRIKPFKTQIQTSAPKEISVWMDRIIKFCEDEQLQFADNRSKQGALWVYHPIAEGPSAQQLADWGFRFTKNKGWWLK